MDADTPGEATQVDGIPTPPLIPGVLAGLVFLFGFGMLNLFSLITEQAEGLRGLYSYRSATVGDGLLLPLLVYALTRSGGWHRPWPRGTRPILLASGAVGVLLGLTTQIVWLVSDTTPLNWTVPAPHTFNGAGIYHAVFLTLMCGLLFVLSAAAWVRLRSASRPKELIRSAGAFGITIPALGFSALLALDNATGLVPSLMSLGSTFLLAAAALFLAFASASRWRHARSAALLVAASLLPVAAVSLLLLPVPGLREEGMFVAAGALLAGVAVSSTSPRRLAGRILEGLIVGLCLAGPLVLCINLGPMTWVQFVAGVGLAAALGLGQWVLLLKLAGIGIATRVNNTVVASAGILLALTLGGVFLADNLAADRAVDNWVPSVGAIVITCVVVNAIRKCFRGVIQAERDPVMRPQLSELKGRAYHAIAGISGSAFAVFVLYMMALSPRVTWAAGSWNGITELLATGVVLAVLFGLLLLPMRKDTRLWFLLACGSLIAWLAVQVSMVVWVWQPQNWLLILVAVYLAVFGGRFTYEAVTANMSLIHNKPLDVKVRAIAELGAAASALTVFALVSGALGAPGKPNHPGVAAIALAIAILATLLLPFLASKSLDGLVTPLSHIPATPLGGVLQDSLMVVLGTVFLGWIPIFALIHVQTTNSWVGFLFSYLAATGSAYVFIMRNNVAHVATIEAALRSEQADLGLPPETSSEVSAIRRHCEHQNRIGLGFFVVFLAVGYNKGDGDAFGGEGLEPDNWVLASMEKLTL